MSNEAGAGPEGMVDGGFVLCEIPLEGRRCQDMSIDGAQHAAV